MSCTYDLLAMIARYTEMARNAHIGAINHPSASLRQHFIEMYQHWLASLKNDEASVRWYLRYNRDELIAKCKAE